MEIDINEMDETCEIIIELKDSSRDELERIKKFGTIKHYFPIINSCVVEVSKKNLQNLQLHENIASVFENTHITAQMNNGRRAVKADSAHSIGIDGSSVTIAFLDTGIAPVDDFIYPRNRILAFKDFVYGGSSAYDDNGHGTHVAC